MSFGINAKIYEQAFDKVYREIKRSTDKLYERDGNQEDCAEYYYDSLTAAWWAFEEVAGQQFGHNSPVMKRLTEYWDTLTSGDYHYEAK